MARDAKIVQRGIDEQSNDLAVPAGTTVDSENLAFDRDGVGARRNGTQLLSTGLPQNSFDIYDAPLNLGITRGAWDLFSGDVAFHMNQGLIFALDEIESTKFWSSVPVNLSHKYTFHGNAKAILYNSYWSTYGRMVIADMVHPFFWQLLEPGVPLGGFSGTPGNQTSDATDGTGTLGVIKYRTPFDVVSIGSVTYLSDDTTIRGAFNYGSAVLAGSITVSGATDATGSSARFNGASWMTTDGTNLFVADNTNEIRKVTPLGVVTTFAGSTTAGDTDGVGTAARFRNISGICYSGGFLYVSEGASAHRIRKVDTTTASVTIYAGALTPTSGFTNATGTAARFNTPVGIEVVGTNLYVGDTVNKAIRRIVISSAAVTTFAGNTASSITAYIGQGLVPGSLANAILPSVTVRSVYTVSDSPYVPSATGFTAGTYLCIECIAPNSSQDVGFVPVLASVTDLSTTEYVYHTVRSPSSLSSSASPPNKLDSFGVNVYSNQNVMAADTVGGAVFTTSEQPRAMDVYNRFNVTDPMPRLRPLGIRMPEAPSCSTASGTTFAANTAWAYRTLCGLKLPNGRIALGPPSERVIVTTGSQVAGSVTAFPSPGLPYDGLPFVQVYRTKTTSSSLTDPGDTMFLCYEAALTYGQGISFTDSLPDDLLGAELYTNQYAFGASSASLPPPSFANEVASFNQQCVLANFNPAASCRVKVLGVSTLVSGTSTITFTFTQPYSLGSGNIFTVNFNSAATDPSIRRAQIASAGSAAQNAVQTARNIVRVINRSPDAFMLTAIYDESDPGSFVVYSLHPGSNRNQRAVDQQTGNATTVQANIDFSTNASSSFATIALNSAQRQVNAIAPSDQGDIDSFPVINQATVGPSTEAILRALPIAETLLVVKDDTIFRTDSSYAFQIYETALSCSLPNSFARLNNQWIGLFNAGFRALTSSQAVAIGRQIDRRVQNLFAAGSYLGDADFASAAAVDRQGVYLCAFNKSVFAYSAYGGGAWGTFAMPYVNQPSWLGAHSDAFIPVISDYPNGTFWQLVRSNSPAFLDVYAYESLFYDGKFTGTIAATVTSSSTNVQVTFPSLTSPLGILPPDFSGAYIYSLGSGFLLGAVILSGDGSSGNPFIVNQTLGNSIATGTAVQVFMPTEIMAQYAPSLSPGVNSQFGDIGVTIERGNGLLSHSGSLTCTFYNRSDVLKLNNGASAVPEGYPYGQYSSGQGISRTNVLPEARDSGNLYASYKYTDFQRFATPSDRSQDQLLIVKLTNRLALCPLAIKAVVIEQSEGGKVKQ